MAKGRKALQEDMRARDKAAWDQQQAALAAGKEPSAAEKQREAERQAYFAWKEKGDFRNAPPSLLGFTYGPEAQARRQMEQTALPTGAGGMGAGYASPTALALNRQYLNDVNAERDALAYQQQLQGEDLYQRTGNAAQLMQADYARKMEILRNTSQQTQYYSGARIQTTPQSIWPALLSGALSAGGAFLGGPGFAAMMRPAGGGGP